MRIIFAGLALCCAVVFFPLSPAFADNFFGGGLGVNFSSLTNFPGYSGDSEFQIGAFADWDLMDIWYLETGLRYNSYGVSESTTSGSTTTNVSFDVHYLEIPVLIKPRIEVNGWYPYALAGPIFGFNVGNSASTSVNGASSTSVSLNTYNTMNVALDFGVGCEIPVMTTFRGFLQFDYALGLTNILSTSSTTSVTAETRGANFTVGVAIPF